VVTAIEEPAACPLRLDSVLSNPANCSMNLHHFENFKSCHPV